MNTRPSIHPNAALCVAAVVVAGFLCGCSTSARFSVQAGAPGGTLAAGQSYRLTAGPALAAAPAPNDRIFRDVRTALSGRGLFEAPEGLTPDLEVEVDLGQGRAIQRELTHAVPVYVEGTPPVSNAVTPGRGGTDVSRAPRKIGEREVTRVVTVYPKYLRLTARPVRHPGIVDATRTLWRIEVTNEDESSDLETHARLMVAAAMDWIGRSTAAPIEIVMGAHDSRVAFLEQGLATPRNVAAGRLDEGRDSAQVDG